MRNFHILKGVSNGVKNAPNYQKAKNNSIGSLFKVWCILHYHYSIESTKVIFCYSWDHMDSELCVRSKKYKCYEKCVVES